MNDQKDRKFVQHSIDTGLESMQGNPFLAQRIMNQERMEQPVMKKKISFAFILAMVLMLACAATALAGAVNENFNAWLYRIWPEAATTLMPVHMSCENNGIRMEIISAAADGQELYITYSLEDLEGDRLNIENSPVLYVESFPDYLWEASFEQPMKDEATGKVIFGEHFQYQGSITAANGVLKAHLPSFTSSRETALIDLFPYLEQYGGEVSAMDMPEGARTLWAHDSYLDDQPIDGDTAVALRVIDNSSPLEIPLAETVFLSGIGMVDGQLHVQLHYVNHRKIILGKGLDTIAYRPDETGIMLRGKDCEYWYDSRYQDEDRLPGGISAIGWGSQTDDTDTPEWAEIIFTADAAELSADLHEFFAEIRETIPIQGSWDAEIPVRLIRHID